VKRLSRVSDPNVAQMLGIIRQKEPLAIVMECLSHGDLHQFLQQRVFDDGNDRMYRSGPPSLRYIGLLYTNLAIMRKKFVCLSVIRFWRLLCCTVADPDLGV